MSGRAKFNLFINRQSLIGPVLWAFCVQYYVVQAVVARGWSMPFSLTGNTISDLGNTVCREYGMRLVCSPLHMLMNVSFVVLGFSMILGSLLVHPRLGKNRMALLACVCIAIAGAGTLLVGCFPENTVRELHIVGAGLSFVFGNLGLACFGFVTGVPRWLRVTALLLGVLALAALVLFVTHTYLGIGIGGMERIVAYPQTVWLILFGVYLLFARGLR